MGRISTMKWAAGIYLAGLLTGAAGLYTQGGWVGSVLRYHGGHLVQLDGDVPLGTAAEVQAVVDATAADAVTTHVQRVMGSRLPQLPPARVVRR